MLREMSENSALQITDTSKSTLADLHGSNSYITWFGVWLP